RGGQREAVEVADVAVLAAEVAGGVVDAQVERGVFGDEAAETERTEFGVVGVDTTLVVGVRDAGGRGEVPAAVVVLRRNGARAQRERNQGTQMLTVHRSLLVGMALSRGPRTTVPDYRSRMVTM